MRTRSTISTCPSTHPELIVRIGERDRDAFDVLYSRFARSVLGLARRRINDRFRAEEATQDTFAAIRRSARTYRPERGPGARWIYAVARNAIADRARACRRSRRCLRLTDGRAGPGRTRRARMDSLARIPRVEALPPLERSLIELVYWSDFSQSQIAARLGMPLGTVKTGTRRALARLATLLERESQLAD